MRSGGTFSGSLGSQTSGSNLTRWPSGPSPATVPVNDPEPWKALLLKKDKESSQIWRWWRWGRGGAEVGLRPRKEPLVLPGGSKSAVSARSRPGLFGCQDA